MLPAMAIARHKKLPYARVKDAVPVPAYIAYLLHDCAGTLDELPFGEAVSGAELQSSSFLDQVDTAMAQLLHPCLYLEANLKAQPGIHLHRIHPLICITLLHNYNHVLNWLVSYPAGG